MQRLPSATDGVVGKQTGYRTQTVEAKYVMPDFVGQVQAKTGLAKSTVARILLESGRLNDAVNNPQAFIDHASELVNAVKREFLVYGDGSDGSGVKYVKLDDAVYEMRRFERDDLMEVFASNVHAVEKQEKTLFSHIVIDSNSGPERALCASMRGQRGRAVLHQAAALVPDRNACRAVQPRLGTGLPQRLDALLRGGNEENRAYGIMCSSTCCDLLKTSASSAASGTSRTSSRCSSRWLVRLRNW